MAALAIFPTRYRIHLYALTPRRAFKSKQVPRHNVGGTLKSLEYLVKFDEMLVRAW